MKEITGYDLRTDAELHTFFKEAYVENKGVIIPAELVKDFVELGCRRVIAVTPPFSK